jgi:hypothetical protein
MKEVKLLSIILFFLPTGLLLFTACPGSDKNDNTVIPKTITISGTINVTYENNAVPIVEIGIDTSEFVWINYDKLESPGANADWAIELPAFDSLTDISFRVIGYNSSKSRLFSKIIYSSTKAYNENISGINLDLENFSNTPENIIPLKENKWSNGEIIKSEKYQWYSFDVTNGTKYYLWWNDSDNGDETKTLDIDVYAYDNNKISIILENNDKAWDEPVSFISKLTGKVFIRVQALYGAAAIGTYAIVYSTSEDKPDNSVIIGSEDNPVQLTINEWTNDSIPSSTSGNTIWYSFEVAKEETYYIWWNDGGIVNGKNTGDGTKTLDVKVNIYYGGGAPIYAEIDFSWDTVTDSVSPNNNRPISFKSDLTGTVKLEVLPFFTDGTGTFAVAYSNQTLNPGVIRP